MAATALKDAARTEESEIDAKVVWRNSNLRKELPNDRVRMNSPVQLQIVALKLLHNDSAKKIRHQHTTTLTLKNSSVNA